jgi:hypothetical protein
VEDGLHEQRAGRAGDGHAGWEDRHNEGGFSHVLNNIVENRENITGIFADIHKKSMRGAPAACLAAVLAAPAAAAGPCSKAMGEPRHDFQFLAGFSPGSTATIGTARDRRMVLAGLSYGYRCRAAGGTSFFTQAGAFPAAILLQPERTGRGAVYGFAVTPLGLRAEFGRTRRVRPFAEVNGGVIASTEPIPDRQPNATGLNFLFDLGGGIRWTAGRGRAVSVGYKFLHTSNAGTTSFNPGVDNHVIYAGYSFLR